MGRLSGKVAIITGAASGQGAAEAKLFAKEGAKVVATDIQYELLLKVVKEITNSGGEAIAVNHDVTNATDWTHVVEEAVNQFKKVDILVNNAGIGGIEAFALFDQVDLESWNRYMNVNATSQFLGIKAVLPEMRKVGAGSIINISSVAGLRSGASGVHYTASKGASRLLTKKVAAELGKENIRANCVFPGFIDTPMVSVVTQNKDATASAIKNIPIGRVGQPEDVGSLVLFLASDDSSFITGGEFVIDGGQTG